MPQPNRISVIIPVLAEGDRINALIDHLRMVGYGTSIELVVVDGDPAGATLAALDRPGVTGLTASRGRARQQNAGAAVASGDILLFLHADTRLPAGAFAAVTAALSGPARAGAFSLAIRSRHPWLRLVAAGANLRSRLFGLPYGDQALFWRRETFRALGGFPDIPVMEEVALLRALARTGIRPVILSAKATTSARRWQAEGPYRATWRNLGLLARFLWGVPPERLAARYPSMPELAETAKDGEACVGPTGPASNGPRSTAAPRDRRAPR